MHFTNFAFIIIISADSLYFTSGGRDFPCLHFGIPYLPLSPRCFLLELTAARRKFCSSNGDSKLPHICKYSVLQVDTGNQLKYASILCYKVTRGRVQKQTGIMHMQSGRIGKVTSGNLEMLTAWWLFPLLAMKHDWMCLSFVES